MSDEAPTLTAAAVGPAAEAPPRRRRVLAAALGLVALVVAVVAALATRGGGDGDSAVQAGTGTPAAATATPTSTAATPPARPRVARIFRHVGDRPNDVEVTGGQLWVTSARASMQRLDAMTGRPRERDKNVPSGGKAVSVHGNRVWVANSHTSTVLAFDARSHRVLVSVPQPGRPIAVAADDSGGVWVGIRGAGNLPPDTLIHYDAGGHPVYQRSIVQGINAIVLSPDAVWVAETNVPKLMRVDRRTGHARTGTLLLSEAGALAYGGGYVWASVPTDGSVAKVNPRTGRSIAATVGQRPSQLAYTAGRVFVACLNDQALVVIDPKTLRRTDRLTVAFSPYAVVADAHHVWVTGLGRDTVTRVDVR
jgi:DNA-binding beta-propeller fold protein YncE